MSKNRSRTAVEPASVVTENLSLNDTVLVEVTILDDSSVDAEHLGMTKTRMMKMTTDGHNQTHHHSPTIQIQSNKPEATHS